MSQDELEEHGLVLAIQAAHLASKTKRLTTEQANGEQGILDAELGLVSGWELAGHSASNPYAALNHQNRRDSRSYRSSPALRSVTNGVVAIEERERLLADNTSSSGSDSAPEIPREQVLQEDRPKLSAAVFLLVVLMYSVCCLMQSSISFIIPVWLTSTSESGGLSVSVLHRGFLFSAASLLLYVGHILAGSYLTALVRSSPVRVLRLCCGCLVVLFFLSPITIRYFYGQISDAEPVLMKGAPAIQYSPFLLKDSDSASSGKRNSPSLMALILASGLLALTGGVAYAARKASGMLFYLALAPTFTSPTVLITAVAGFADVSGPVLGALIFCSVYDLRLSVPMDASFVLSCCGCACSLTYLLSLLINIQFRGDFGLITDEGTAKTNSSIHSNSQGNYFSTPSGMSRSSGSSSGSNLLDVPMGDLSLLLSPPITGYGTRHDSLRIDLKEV